MKKDKPCNMTECTQQWDYMYVSDVADAILTLCNGEYPSGAYNLASGDVRTLREYVEELYSIIGSKSELNYGAIPYPTTGMVSIIPGIEKMYKVTGWKSKIKFSDGVIEILTDDLS